MALQAVPIVQPAATEHPARATLLSPFRVGVFRVVWAGYLCYCVGDQAQMVILSVLALDLVHTTSGLGAILTAGAMPQVLLMVLGGLAADRFRPQLVLRAALVLDALGLGALAVLSTIGHVAVGELYAYAIVYGVLAAFNVPATSTLVPATLPAALVRQGNAVRSLALNIARFLAPAAATTLLGVAGATPALAATGVAFVCGALLFGGVATEKQMQRSAPILRQLRDGLAAARQDGAVGTSILLLTIFNFGFSSATFVGVPALAKLVLGAGSQGVGFLLGAFGAGALLGAISAGALPTMRRLGLVSCGTIIGIGLALASAGLAPTLWAAAASLALSGAFVSSTAVLLLTLVQTRAAAEVRGRVMALFNLGLTGLTPLAYGLGGLVGDLLGPRSLLVLGGATIVLAGALGLGSTTLRRAE